MRMLPRGVRSIVPVLVTLILVSLGGRSALSQSEFQDIYRLGSGDRVEVTVFGHEDLSGEFEVDGAGSLSLPLIGSVRAGGLSLSDLERAIIVSLRPDYLLDPQVSVNVTNYRPFYIIGEIKNPGSYAYVNGMTAINAIALAGGYTYRARENRLMIERVVDSQRVEIDASRETIILPGDVIQVPERIF